MQSDIIITVEGVDVTTDKSDNSNQDNTSDNDLPNDKTEDNTYLNIPSDDKTAETDVNSPKIETKYDFIGFVIMVAETIMLSLMICLKKKIKKIG